MSLTGPFVFLNISLKEKLRQCIIVCWKELRRAAKDPQEFKKGKIGTVQKLLKIAKNRKVSEREVMRFFGRCCVCVFV